MDYLGKDIKKLGFGLMRLPRTGDSIDIEQTKRMVDMFMAAGFTYFDTAWAYTGSEEAIKQALVMRYPRESFVLASKNAAWIDCNSRADCEKQFNESLERTGAGYFDFYLLHNLGESRTKNFEDYDVWNLVKQKKQEGLIKHIGFSFHAGHEELDKILTAHPEAEFVQLQINYADWESPLIESRACYEVARAHGKPVVIMEPLKGGNLATPPKSAEEIFKSAQPQMSAASWAIRFAASLEGVITVLSGMSNIAQMEDNISYMKDFCGLTEEEKAVIEKVRAELARVPVIPCTACNYCAKVCPMNIGISGYFTAKNTLEIYKNPELAKGQFNWLVNSHDKAHAEECIGCGACESVCPQHISIREELEKAGKIFADNVRQ